MLRAGVEPFRSLVGLTPRASDNKMKLEVCAEIASEIDDLATD